MISANGYDDDVLWRPLPAKLRAYEAVYWLNRSFAATLLSLERLERLGMFRPEYLQECKIRIEYTQAEANQEFTDYLNQQEVEDSAHFDRLRFECEKRNADPDDVFFHAKDRRQEIKDQIREPAKGPGTAAAPAPLTLRQEEAEARWKMKRVPLGRCAGSGVGLFRSRDHRIRRFLLPRWW